MKKSSGYLFYLYRHDHRHQDRQRLQCTVSAFTCVHCNNTNAVGVLCYGVEMVIADDTAVESILPAKAAPNTGAGPSGVNTTKSPARMF
ncbi:BnaCnng36280D [Brassica napus]|uniref:BnaCnng36280D protein n=2 Tax=Brassica napus TaxID=3708 RepID=A0A078J947_BRANA|nr:BnaCnng36280D [Brassica napus]